MGQTSWQDYLKLLRGLSKTLKELTQLEQEKNAAASAGNLAGVEACMKREQVMSLSQRYISADAMLADLGMSGIPLRGLEDRCPEEFRLETKKVAEELRQQYELFQTASRAARSTLECNLRVIEKMQAVQAGDSAQAEERRKAHQTDFRA